MSLGWYRIGSRRPESLIDLFADEGLFSADESPNDTDEDVLSNLVELGWIAHDGDEPAVALPSGNESHERGDSRDVAYRTLPGGEMY